MPGNSRQELLRALLAEEELRADRRPGGLLSSEQMQGFLWGLGAAALLIMVLPSAKEALRPFAVKTVKGALDVVDQLKSVLGEAGEGLQDLVAEAQFERAKEAGEPPQS